ncbi:hypothetical protein [Streptomyces coffeae]|uniref:Uncharacterized protein n=1 Tax=Streptomyces coffeae TaxID=621382 RepID=A0ABS1NE95_9ACTN|nr:hypothetical protein [Streptomyces coffeae]MBL1098272.1 hypothetical protein [Streptomyces coffeae]
MHHHHGYTWLGSGHDLLKDGPRRPIHPEFASSKVVPLELAHWLLKPPSFVQGTWTDPTQAADWFGNRAREHADSFASDHDRAPETLSAKVQGAAEAVAGGEDVAGGWYLTGQRFLSVCLIACGPHRLRPGIGCPQRRT